MKKTVNKGEIMKLSGCIAFALALLAPGSPGAAEIVKLTVRPGVTESYLLMASPSAPPKAVALMFIGGNGALRLPDDISNLRVGRRANFLVRARGMFRDRETAVAIVDVPSDRRSGMDDGFRASGTHADDIRVVIGDLRNRFPEAKIFLVGTSRGTVSAAYVGRTTGDSVAGVVLTSTLFDGGNLGIGLRDFDFKSIRGRLLFVHHQNDACKWTPHREALRQAQKGYTLITIVGGKPAETGPCDPLSAHGYFGKEEVAVNAIKNWMFGRPYPQTAE
jgi:hypothetical protein